jgi:ABC-type Mn2+/Zn2+ transport system permease subunit
MRKSFNHKLEIFWVIAGLLFVIGGIWGLLKIDVPLIPILIIIAGIVILTQVFKGKKEKSN